MKHSYIKPISKKQSVRLKEYHKLLDTLIELSGNVSELSGDRPDWQSDFKVEGHHIEGRIGNKLTDPFNIILLTRNEHVHWQKHMSYENKQYLLRVVKKIRIKQLFIKGQ